MKEATTSSSAGRRRHLAMRGLVALQVAAATAFVVGAGLMFRSVWNILSVDIGFDVGHNVLMEVRLPSSRYGTGEQQRLRSLRFRGFRSWPKRIGPTGA